MTLVHKLCDLFWSIYDTYEGQKSEKTISKFRVIEQKYVLNPVR